MLMPLLVAISRDQSAAAGARTCGLDDADLNLALLSQFGELLLEEVARHVGLCEGEGGPTGADLDRRHLRAHTYLCAACARHTARGGDAAAHTVERLSGTVSSCQALSALVRHCVKLDVNLVHP